MADDDNHIGRVVGTTRRFVEVALGSGDVVLATRGARDLAVCVGDNISLVKEPEGLVVQSFQPRRNLLKRAYGRVEKELVSNLDLLFVVAAPHPLFNTTFVDRVLVTAEAEGIPQCLVVNKVDLDADLALTKPLIDAYVAVGVPVYFTSGVTGVGLEELVRQLSQPDVKVAALIGMSGVGKSTILNQLVPGASTRTGEVSGKTGQGRQTTSHAIAHIFSEETFLVDLPGIQNFGITHLSDSEVRSGFPEMRILADECQFANCTHQKEPDCRVLRAIDSEEIAQSRYDSYINMLEELANDREW